LLPPPVFPLSPICAFWHCYFIHRRPTPYRNPIRPISAREALALSAWLGPRDRVFFPYSGGASRDVRFCPRQHISLRGTPRPVQQRCCSARNCRINTVASIFPRLEGRGAWPAAPLDRPSPTRPVGFGTLPHAIWTHWASSTHATRHTRRWRIATSSLSLSFAGLKLPRAESEEFFQDPPPTPHLNPGAPLETPASSARPLSRRGLRRARLLATT